MKKTIPTHKTACQGDIILFSKKGIEMTGEVLIIRENSVIVEIAGGIAKQLDLENERTVVNHSCYEIVKRSTKPIEHQGVNNPNKRFIKGDNKIIANDTM